MYSLSISLTRFDGIVSITISIEIALSTYVICSSHYRGRWTSYIVWRVGSSPEALIFSHDNGAILHQKLGRFCPLFDELFDQIISIEQRLCNF